MFTGLTTGHLFHKLKTSLTRPSHLDTCSIKCRSTYIHGRHGDFQRGTSASWYVSVDVRTRAGGSQSGFNAKCFIVATVALPTVGGGEGAAKQTAGICTDMMGGVVWVGLRCRDNPLAPTQIPLPYPHVNTYVDQ